MQAQQERQLDEYERMAHEAMMNRQAQHAKKAKLSDLFKRPTGDIADKSRLTRMKENTQDANAWLSRLSAGRKE